MKKKIIIGLGIGLFIVFSLFSVNISQHSTSTNLSIMLEASATIPNCDNGCLACGEGCLCGSFYPNLLEGPPAQE